MNSNESNQVLNLKIKQTPTINIVLTEILLPNLDGICILREVTKNKPNVPVIA